MRSSFERGAAQVVRVLEVSAEELPELLVLDQYNNESILVHNYVKSIFETSRISQESSLEIRKMLNTVTRHLRSSKALGQPRDSWDTLLIYLLSSKLNKRTAWEWEEKLVKMSRRNKEILNNQWAFQYLRFLNTYV